MENQNKKDDKSMTDKQKNYIEGLLSDKRISNKYEDYRQYGKCLAFRKAIILLFI